MFRNTATAVSNVASKFAAYYRARHGSSKNEASSRNSAAAPEAQEAQHESATRPINKKRKSSDGANKPRAKRQKGLSRHLAKTTGEVNEEASSKSPQAAAASTVDSEESLSDEELIERYRPRKNTRTSEVKSPAKKTKCQVKKMQEVKETLRRSPRAAAAWKVDYHEEESASESDDETNTEEWVDQYRPKKTTQAAPKQAYKKKHKNYTPRSETISFTPLTGMNAADESSLPGPGWTLGASCNNTRCHTLWISPQRKIAFRRNVKAQEFESIRQKYHGDEYMAWDDYRCRILDRNGTYVINPRQYDSPGAGRYYAVHDTLVNAGWERVARLQKTNGFRNQWLSPQFKIEFKFGGGAIQFEEIRQKCDGDEEKAWHLFVEKFPSTRVQSYVDGGLHGLEKARRGECLE